MTYKTKEQRTMKTYQADFPWTENKVFFFTSSVSSTRSFEWNLETINICTNCQFIWSGKMYIWLPVWEFKNYASGNHVSTSSCLLRIEILITLNVTCMWTFHTRVFVSHACTQITKNTFINELVFFTVMIRCSWGYRIFSNHESWSPS